MTTTVQRPPADPAKAAGPAVAGVPWATGLASGVAVLLAAGPVSAVVEGTGWWGHAAVAVVAVVVAGLLLHRTGPALVAAGQCAGVLAVLTATFAEDGVFDVLPGPGAWREFGTLVVGAGQQIDTGTAPVSATPEILFLVTAAFGLLTVGVHLAAVGAAAPAAAGIPLLAVFAVPAALADDLLPWWTMAGAALGFGLLLLARGRVRAQLAAGTVLVAGAVALAVGIGAGAGFVGTSGRFEGSGTGVGPSGSIGLSPFTALRGQLDQSSPVELFRVRGLDRATYLRALTLSEYVPDAGWKATRPAPGLPLPGQIAPGSRTPGETVEVDIENVAFRDYWLPLYGEPLEVGGVAVSQWVYDPVSATGYTGRPREEEGWQLRTVLPAPTVDQLRRAQGVSGAGPNYLDVTGVDPRVAEIAQEVVAGQESTFDRALALQDWFTGPGSAFTYSLQTAPGAGDDALVEFLTVGRVGYCEQFASAMAVMLRTVGIPARVAVGFTAGVDAGEYRSVSTSDAHAWVEAWFPGVGWTTFDPTPLTDGRAVAPPYVLEARAEAAAAAGTAPEDELPSDQPGQVPTPAPAAEPLTSGPADPAAGGDAGLPWWPPVVVLLAVVTALVPAGLRIHRRRRRLAAVAAGGPGAAAAGWAELLAESTDRGVPSPPSDTVRGAARRLVREHRLDPEAQQALRHVVTAAESSFYGAAHPAAGDLDEPVRAVRAGIAAGTTLSLRGRLFPGSVLGGLGAWRRPDDGAPLPENDTAASRN